MYKPFTHCHDSGFLRSNAMNKWECFSLKGRKTNWVFVGKWGHWVGGGLNWLLLHALVNLSSNTVDVSKTVGKVTLKSKKIQQRFPWRLNSSLFWIFWKWWHKYIMGYRLSPYLSLYHIYLLWYNQSCRWIKMENSWLCYLSLQHRCNMDKRRTGLFLQHFLALLKKAEKTFL